MKCAPLHHAWIVSQFTWTGQTKYQQINYHSALFNNMNQLLSWQMTNIRPSFTATVNSQLYRRLCRRQSQPSPCSLASGNVVTDWQTDAANYQTRTTRDENLLSVAKTTGSDYKMAASSADKMRPRQAEMAADPPFCKMSTTINSSN